MRLDLDLSPEALVSVSFRVTQFIFSLLALSTLVGGFRVMEGRYSSRNNKTYHTMAGSPTTNFMLLLTYSSMMFALWHVVVVDLTRFAPRMCRLVQWSIDGVFVVVFLAGSIAFTITPYVADCELFAEGLRCGSMTASVVFSYFTLVSYAGCLAVSVLQSRRHHKSQMDDTGLLDAEKPEVVSLPFHTPELQH